MPFLTDATLAYKEGISGKLPTNHVEIWWRLHNNAYTKH